MLLITHKIYLFSLVIHLSLSCFHLMAHPLWFKLLRFRITSEGYKGGSSFLSLGSGADIWLSGFIITLWLQLLSDHKKEQEYKLSRLSVYLFFILDFYYSFFQSSIFHKNEFMITSYILCPLHFPWHFSLSLNNWNINDYLVLNSIRLWMVFPDPRPM